MTYKLEGKQQRSSFASKKEDKTVTGIQAAGEGQCLLNRETKPRMNT